MNITKIGRGNIGGGRDAGNEPVSIGGLENARALEDFVPRVLAKIGQVFYRFAPPGER
jgi:hypothetical protein